MKRYLLNIFAVIIGWASLCAAGPDDSGEMTLKDTDVVVLGDSNTWIGGDDNSSPRGWNYWFARETGPRSMRSYARSGATWSNTAATGRDLREYTEILSDDNVIYNQVMRLVEAVDSGIQPAPGLIMIAAGTNDAWFPEHRPEEFSLTASEALSRDPLELLSLPPSKVTSLAASVRYSLLILKGRFPAARIIVLTPLQSVKISDRMLSDVSAIIQEVARGEGCGVIRQDTQCPVRSDSERFNRKLTTDGTHTSEEGGRLNALAIAAAVRTLMSRPE